MNIMNRDLTIGLGACGVVGILIIAEIMRRRHINTLLDRSKNTVEYDIFGNNKTIVGHVRTDEGSLDYVNNPMRTGGKKSKRSSKKSKMTKRK